MDKKKETWQEENYTTEELAKGILFLIKEYYIGDFDRVDDNIVMKFDNGQSFVLEIKEV